MQNVYKHHLKITKMKYFFKAKYQTFQHFLLLIAIKVNNNMSCYDLSSYKFITNKKHMNVVNIEFFYSESIQVDTILADKVAQSYQLNKRTSTVTEV